MNGYAAYHLQRGIMDKLRGEMMESTALKHITLSDKWAGKEVEGPMLTFGESKTHLWRGASFEGESHEFKLMANDIATSASEAKKITGALISSLHGCDMALPGQALIDLSFEWEAMTQKQGQAFWSSEICFKALTVSD